MGELINDLAALLITIGACWFATEAFLSAEAERERRRK